MTYTNPVHNTAKPRKFAAFDIDGTLFRSGLYREVFYELYKMGVLPNDLTEQTTEKYRQWRHRLNGNAFEEFEQLMVNGLDSYLPQLRVTDYETAVKRVIDKKADNVYVHTHRLLKNLQRDGYFTVDISGSQQELVEPFAQRYGFDTWIGQYWERRGAYFTGEKTVTYTGKDKIIEQLLRTHNLTLADSYAVGDSNGDAGMLGIVEHPIAFNPTFELLEKAIDNSWKIVVERKNVSYELQKDDQGETVLRRAEHN